MKEKNFIPERFMTVILPDGKHLKPVIRMTDKGCSDYANRMYCHYHKIKGEEYADQITIAEDRMTSDFEIVRVNEWHA